MIRIYSAQMEKKKRIQLQIEQEISLFLSTECVNCIAPMKGRKFTFLGSSVSTTETNIDTPLTKAWTANDSLSVIWKSDLTDKMKRSFFQTAVVSILLYGCTTLTLSKRMEEKLDGNYTRMLRAILNKSWRQHSTKHQLCGHQPPITKTIKLDEPDMQDTAVEAGTSS